MAGWPGQKWIPIPNNYKMMSASFCDPFGCQLRLVWGRFGCDFDPSCLIKFEPPQASHPFFPHRLLDIDLAAWVLTGAEAAGVAPFFTQGATLVRGEVTTACQTGPLGL